MRNESSISPGPMPNPAVKRSIAGGTTVCRIPLYLSPDRSRGAAERLFSAAAGVCVWKDALSRLFKNYPRKTRGQLLEWCKKPCDMGCGMAFKIKEAPFSSPMAVRDVEKIPLFIFNKS